MRAGYERAGAAAISVLTEPAFFDGHLDHLAAVRAVTDLPILRKDFVVDRYQILEARAAGADAILLIVAALTPPALEKLHQVATHAGLDVLVEIHDLFELPIALDAGASIVGVNNRNLRTLAVDTDVSRQAVELIPDDVIAVAESGLKTSGDLLELASAGYDAFLIGERFMATDDPGQALADLLKDARTVNKLFVKICGITRSQDAELAAGLGASALGFVFWPDSPRYVSAETAKAIDCERTGNVLKVGVFVDQPVEDVARIMDEAGLDVAQLHGHESPDYCRQLMVRLKPDTTEAEVPVASASGGPSSSPSA